MRIESLVLWVLGLGILLAAMWVAWTLTPLSAMIPYGVALAVALLVVAIAVFGLARALNEEPTVVRRRRRVIEED